MMGGMNPFNCFGMHILVNSNSQLLLQAVIYTTLYLNSWTLPQGDPLHN